jgi:cell division control protein 45
MLLMDYCSHRPVDVHNVYNQVQVKMLMKEADCDNIPAFDDVFRDDEDEAFQVANEK